MNDLVDLVVEITPFVSVILIKSFSTSVDEKFDDKFRSLPEGDELGDGDIEVAKKTALLSHHHEQSRIYTYMAIIWVFIIFSSRAYREGGILSLTFVFMILLLLGIIALNVWASDYFKSIKPVKYADSEEWSLKGRTFRRGDTVAIVSNFLPIAALVLLQLLDYVL